MLSLKRVFVLLIFACVAGFSLPVHADSAAPVAREQTHEKRESFAHDFANKVLAIIQDSKKIMPTVKTFCARPLAKSPISIGSPNSFLAKLGAPLLTTQKQRYTVLYRKYLTESYVTNFAENSRQTHPRHKTLASMRWTLMPINLPSAHRCSLPTKKTST